VVPGGESTGTRPQIDDVAAFVGGEILPQPTPFTVELHHQALAAIAVDVADIELASPGAALREQVEQHGLQAIEQASAERVGIEECRSLLFGRVVVVEPNDVCHQADPQHRSCQGHDLHSKWVGVVACRGSSSPASVAVMTRTARSDMRCASPPSNGTSSNQISSLSLLMAVNSAGLLAMPGTAPSM